MDGSTLTIGDAMAMTRMMCAEELMAVEAAFTTAFVGEHQFQVNGDKLEIIYAAGELIFQGTAAE
jgi:heat shock protein HslJ